MLSELEEERRKKIQEAASALSSALQMFLQLDFKIGINGNFFSTVKSHIDYVNNTLEFIDIVNPRSESDVSITVSNTSLSKGNKRSITEWVAAVLKEYSEENLDALHAAVFKQRKQACVESINVQIMNLRNIDILVKKVGFIKEPDLDIELYTKIITDLIISQLNIYGSLQITIPVVRNDINCHALITLGKNGKWDGNEYFIVKTISPTESQNENNMSKKVAAQLFLKWCIETQ